MNPDKVFGILSEPDTIKDRRVWNFKTPLLLNFNKNKVCNIESLK